MKICPRCNREYEENLENCLVCGANLTTYTPILSEDEREALELNEEPVTEMMLEEINPENLPELIVSVVGEEEARRLSVLMQEYRIPCMCKENGEEEDVFDLFVPKTFFNKAFALLQADEEALELQEEQEELFLEDEELEQEQQEPEESKEEPSKKKKGLFSFFRK